MNELIKNTFIALKRAILEKEYSYLNSEQRKAVFSPDGPLLILAGAGSGKTTVIVSRIEYLIKYGNTYKVNYCPEYITQEHIDLMNSYIATGDSSLQDDIVELIKYNPVAPWRMLAITFTNKAAGELKERLERKIGTLALDIWAATFHSACVRFLRQEIECAGYSKYFTIYDTDDSKRVIKECISRLNLEEKVYNPRSVLSVISNSKNSGLSPEGLAKEAENNPRLKNIANIYSLYVDRLKQADALDFDDIILVTVQILENNPKIREYWSSRFEHILVDEYQDTNTVQYKLIALLRKADGNLCVVGDDDQSIYKFRGATIENILSFEDRFIRPTVIKLERNYRSTQNILDAANSVIKNNRGRKNKTLWTNNNEGDRVVLFNAYDEMHEGNYIADTITKMVNSKHLEYKNFAVLYRTNAQSRAIENSMRLAKIPAKVIGGLSFYDRKEVKDILSYMCVIVNPKDNLRIKRIINEPKRGIGEATVKNVELIAEQQNTTMLDICVNADNYPALSRAKEKLKGFASIINGLSDFLDENPMNLLVEEILEKSGYDAALMDDENYKDRIANISELNTAIIKYMEEEEEPTLFGFLERISLVSDVDNYEQSDDVVSLMTLHTAKGLEFDYVFIPGVEEGLFPSSMSMEEDGGIEEERRLCYVGITRARKGLTLLNAKRRTIYGATTYPELSRFVKEIPDELLDERGVKKQESEFIEDYNTPTSFTLKQTYIKPVKETKNVIKQSFSAGERVMHRIFGEGIILSVKAMGNDDLLEIKFGAGVKKIMAAYANLKKI